MNIDLDISLYFLDTIGISAFDRGTGRGSWGFHTTKPTGSWETYAVWDIFGDIRTSPFLCNRQGLSLSFVFLRKLPRAQTDTRTYTRPMAKNGASPVTYKLQFDTKDIKRGKMNKKAHLEKHRGYSHRQNYRKKQNGKMPGYYPGNPQMILKKK